MDCRLVRDYGNHLVAARTTTSPMTAKVICVDCPNSEATPPWYRKLCFIAVDIRSIPRERRIGEGMHENRRVLRFVQGTAPLSVSPVGLHGSPNAPMKTKRAILQELLADSTIAAHLLHRITKPRSL